MVPYLSIQRSGRFTFCVCLSWKYEKIKGDSYVVTDTSKIGRKVQIVYSIPNFNIENHIKHTKNSQKATNFIWNYQKAKNKNEKKNQPKEPKQNKTKQNIKKPSRVFTFTNNVSECSAKFHGQHIVDDRVDGTVDEDHGSTDQPEPGILQLQQIVLEGVVHYDDSVWQPESSEQHHYHDEHAHHLYS